MRVLAVDGQFLHDLKTEEKGETTLVPPSDFMRLRCYFMVFDLLLKGDYAWVFIDGESGREAIVEYAIEHGGPWWPRGAPHAGAPSNLSEPHPHNLPRHLLARAHPSFWSANAVLFVSRQETLDRLDIDLNLMTDVLSTSGGAIFELYIHGISVLILLRASTGSYATLCHMQGAH